MAAVCPAPVVDVQVCVEEVLRSFGGFQGKGETDDQLNIDGSY